MFPAVTETTGMNHHFQLFSAEMGSPKTFLLGLA
jgi:hypothetical protein